MKIKHLILASLILTIMCQSAFAAGTWFKWTPTSCDGGNVSKQTDDVFANTPDGGMDYIGNWVRGGYSGACTYTTALGANKTQIDAIRIYQVDWTGGSDWYNVSCYDYEAPTPGCPTGVGCYQLPDTRFATDSTGWKTINFLNVTTGKNGLGVHHIVCGFSSNIWVQNGEVEFCTDCTTTIPPVAGFSCSPLSGEPPQNVTCTDSSSNSPATWAWSIRNENSSTVVATGTAQNITATLYNIASYTVSLAVSNAAGNDTEIKENYINLGVNTTEYQNGTYTLVAAPDPIGVGGTITITASSSAGWNNVFSYVLTGLPGTNATYGALVNGYPAIWYKKGSTWYQWDGNDYTISWGASFPTTVSTIAVQPGTWTVTGRFFDTGASSGSGGAVATDTITVTGEGSYVPITFRILDNNGNLISGSEIHIRDYGSSSWTNTSTGSGVYSYSVMANHWYQYLGSAAGYGSSDSITSWWDSAATVDVRLTPYLTVAEGNTTLWVYVNNENGNGISDAMVRLQDGQVKTTSSAGVTHFTVLDGGTYTITVSKTGYNSQTWTGTITSSENAIFLTISSKTVGPTSTPAPGVTTLDVRTDIQKDQELMDKIRDFAPQIIDLALLAIIIGLLKLMGFW